MIETLVLVIVGYLVGSVPFGLIVGRVTKGVDIREHGSGMTGMTNVMRTVGVPAAITVLLLDMSKAIVAIALARVFTDSPGVEVAAGIAAVVGHNWPVFSGFRGGRGTATGWGGLLIVAPAAWLAAGVIGIGAMVVTRYASFGSILGVAVAALASVVAWLVGIEPLTDIWYGIIAGAIIIARHNDNIERLLKGEERKFGQAAEVHEASQKPGRGRGLRWPRSV